MTTTRFFGDRFPCPQCGEDTDNATGSEGTTPRHGDISVCLSCGCLRTFLFDGPRLVGYHRVTDEELAALPRHEREALLNARSTALAISDFVAKMRATPRPPPE